MTATAALPSIDWQAWRDRWERQQSTYIPFREERFTAMLDAVELAVGDDFTAIDLMCGPGAITRRLVERFPKARVVAIDLDPVLVAIGRSTTGEVGGRVTWLEGNLADDAWVSLLPVSQVDAVLSTTAIHWLHAGQIVDLYRTLANVIRPGGVLLDGDQLQFAGDAPTLRQLSLTYREAFRQRAHGSGAEGWEAWWLALREEQALVELFAERDRRFAWRPADRERAVGSQVAEAGTRPVVHTTYGVHRAALRDAGFREADTIWQHFDNRVLMAVR